MNGRELSRALDVSEATISRLIHGDRRPSLDLMLKIDGVLRWSLNSQADFLRESPVAYGHELSRRMERRPPPRSSEETQEIPPNGGLTTG